jgi:hypothetical protein
LTKDEAQQQVIAYLLKSNFSIIDIEKHLQHPTVLERFNKVVSNIEIANSSLGKILYPTWRYKIVEDLEKGVR